MFCFKENSDQNQEISEASNFQAKDEPIAPKEEPIAPKEEQVEQATERAPGIITSRSGRTVKKRRLFQGFNPRLSKMRRANLFKS